MAEVGLIDPFNTGFEHTPDVVDMLELKLYNLFERRSSVWDDNVLSSARNFIVDKATIEHTEWLISV
jgi:hypothetical protein